MTYRRRVATTSHGGVIRRGLGAGARIAVAQAVKYYRGYSNTRVKREGGSKVHSNATSAYHDTRLQYSKKRMPRRRRRRWVRFVKKVRAVSVKDQPSTTFFHNDVVASNGSDFLTFTASNLNKQMWCAFMLCGNDGAGYSTDGAYLTQSGGNDLAALCTGIGASNSNFNSFVIGSSVLDISFNSHCNAGVGCAFEVDLYEVRFGTRTDTSGSKSASWISDMSDALTKAGLDNTALVAKGFTPFQASGLFQAGNNWRIMKKRRWQVNSNTPFTYQFRDAKDRRVGVQGVKESSDYVSSPYTRMFLFRISCIPGGATFQSSESAVFRFSCSRTYTVKSTLATKNPNTIVNF